VKQYSRSEQAAQKHVGERGKPAVGFYRSRKFPVVSHDQSGISDRFIELFGFGAVGSPMPPRPDTYVNVESENASCPGGPHAG
jgi:hypothetical protein